MNKKLYFIIFIIIILIVIYFFNNNNEQFSESKDSNFITSSQDIYKLIEDNNMIEYYEKIMQFLKINDSNLVNIKNNNFNIINNDDFYAYVNNKKLNKLISSILSIIYKSVNIEPTITVDDSIYNNINNSLNIDGVYIYNNFIDENTCNTIIEKISNSIFVKANSSINDIKFDNLTTGTNWIKSQSDIIKIEEVQKIATNLFILKIAQNYLNCTPILAQTNLWISTPGNIDQSNSFHQDYDDVNFLKIFIYLNDVDENNGPHSYVKGSLNNMITPDNYKPSDRLPDEYISQNYKDNVLKICGKKGTAIFEDTNGFHKGTILNSGIRYMLQLQYCCSTKLLDNNIDFIHNLNINENKILYDAKLKYPDIFLLYNFNNIETFTNIIHIPMSYDCSSANKLRDIGKKMISYCFDWNIKTIDAIYSLIKNDFKDFLNKEYLIYGNKTFHHKYNNNETQYKDLIPVFNTKYNMLFIHDFTNDSIEDYNLNYDKYTRRIKRFIEDISNKKNTIIILYSDLTDEYINDIYSNWTNYFDNTNIFNHLISNKSEYLPITKKIEDLKILLKEKYLNDNIIFQEINSLI